MFTRNKGVQFPRHRGRRDPVRRADAPIEYAAMRIEIVGVKLREPASAAISRNGVLITRPIVRRVNSCTMAYALH